MDRATARIYQSSAPEWIAARRPRALENGTLDAFASELEPGTRVADLGCGPGWYAGVLRARGHEAIALDISGPMLEEVGRRAPGVPRVRGDLGALPFARGSLGAAWASSSYQHLPLAELPAALAQLHGALAPDAPVAMALANLDAIESRSEGEAAAGEAERRFPDDAFPGRLFSLVTAARARGLLEAAGFVQVDVREGDRRFWLLARARRGHTLPDWIAPGLRLLICGLNPSLWAADAGIPYGRPGNRFWPAALCAGLVARDRDLRDALRRGVGFTDCVKRPTRGASELAVEEYREGLARVEASVRRYAPAALCFVGLDGYRRAVDRRAAPGWIAGGFASRPAYLMPSTSGLNARTSLDELTAHLRAAAAGVQEPDPRLRLGSAPRGSRRRA